MENAYQPFFSRKQLTVLMWFSLLAILVLSSLGPGEVEYQKIEHNKDKTVYWMELDDQLNTLTLLLPTQPALSQSAQQLQQLKAQVLLKRLQNHRSTGFTYNVYPRQDRIELSLNWAGDARLPDIKKLLSDLNQPVEPSRWQDVLTTLEARDYLDNKSTEAKAIQHFYTLLQHESDNVLAKLSSEYTSMFSDITYVVSGEDADDHAELIAELVTETASVTSGPLLTALATGEISDTSDSSRYLLLTGSTIPARNNPEFVAQRLTAQVLQDLLAAYKAQYNIDYRLLWGSLNSGGYQAVILQSEQNPVAILPQLQALIDDDLVEASQNRLANQWLERMRDLQNQIQAMNLVAFYQLPTNTLEDYVEEILDQDRDQVVKLAKEALNGSQPINIQLSPAK